MWTLFIYAVILLLIFIFGPFLRHQYIIKKCDKDKLLSGFKLKPMYQLLEFIDWILQFFFRIRLIRIPKKKLIDEFEKTLNNSILGKHQYLLLEGFIRYVEELDQTPMTLFNRIITRMELQSLIRTRQNVIECLKFHPTITSLTIKAPLIITGLPRTGSTMLYNLLDVDKYSFQSPKIWQMTHLINNPTPSASKTYRQNAFRACIGQVQKISDDILSVLYSSHPPSSEISETSENEGPEEDLLILMHCFPIIVCPYNEWMLNDKASKAYYEYHYKYFQLLQLDNINDKNASWLWKAPTHALFINSLMETYPDARLIITHRHPLEVIPSLAKLYAAYLRIKRMPATLSKKELGRIAFNTCKTMINRMEAARFFIENNPNIIHIHYFNLINNPIDCIKRIYDHCGLSPITPQLMEKFQLQSEKNPQDKYGRMTYNLEEFRLNKNEIETEFANYINWIDKILNSSQQSSDIQK